MRQSICQLFCLIFQTVKGEMVNYVVPGAVPNSEIAIRLMTQLCEDIRTTATFVNGLKPYPIFLRYLVQYSPYIVGTVITGDVDIFQITADVFERQPCLSGTTPAQMDIYQHFIEAVV